MSKRGAEFQGRKEDPGLDRDGPIDPAIKANAKTMSTRKIIAPKSRRGRGGPDQVNAIGNPFASLDPNVANATPPQNPFASLNKPQAQSFPPSNTNTNNQSPFSQNSSFPPPAPNNSGGLFANINGGSSGFTFGSGASSNPFSQASQTNQIQQTPPVDTTRNIFGATPAQSQGGGLFGATSQSFGASQQQTPQPNSNMFAQPKSSFSGFGQNNVTNGASQGQTSPDGNAMEMSPPQKQPSPMFGNLNNAATPSATPTPQQPGSLFANLGKPTTSQAQAESSQSPNLFGDANKTNPPPPPSTNLFGFGKSNNDGQSDTPNLFGNLSKSNNNQPPSSNAPNDPFTGASTPSTSRPGSSSNQPNLFGNLEKPAADNAKESQQRSQATSNLFGAAPKAPSFAAPAQSQTPQPSASSNSSLFGGFNAPATAPAKAQDAGKNPFSNMNQNSPSTQIRGSDRAPGTGLFPSQAPSAQASQTYQPPPFSCAMPGGSAVGELYPAAMIAQEAEAIKKFNEGFLRIITMLTPEGNLTSSLTDLVEAYRSSFEAKFGQDSAASGAQAPGAVPASGAKRKEQADPPEEEQEQRTQKQPNTSAASPLASAFTTPTKEQSNTAKRFQDIVGNSSSEKSQEPAKNLFGSNASSASTGAPSLFSPQSKPTEPPPRLFGNTQSPQKDQPQAPSNPFAGISKSQPEQPKSDTPSLFAGLTRFQPQVEKTTTPGLFGDLSKAQSEQRKMLFGQSAQGSASGGLKPNGGNIFGHLSNRNSEEPEDEEEASEDNDTLEGAMRKRPRSANASKSLFDRISRSPVREDHLSSGASNHPASGSDAASEAEAETDGEERGDDVESALQSSQGDHTWKPSEAIKFGQSINTPPKTNGASLFGQSTQQTSLFKSTITSATPEGSPSKPSDSTPSLFGIKPSAPAMGSLFAPGATSNATSRASTPGTEVNGVSASEAGESDAEVVQNGDDEREDLSDRLGLSAEEKKAEDELFYVEKARLMEFAKDGAEEGPSWKTRGTGPLRVLKNKEKGTVRILHRIAPRGTVSLNAPLSDETKPKKMSKGALQFGASTKNSKKEDVFSRWTAKMASDDTANELVGCLEENATL